MRDRAKKLSLELLPEVQKPTKRFFKKKGWRGGGWIGGQAGMGVLAWWCAAGGVSVAGAGGVSVLWPICCDCAVSVL